MPTGIGCPAGPLARRPPCRLTWMLDASPEIETAISVIRSRGENKTDADRGHCDDRCGGRRGQPTPPAEAAWRGWVPNPCRDGVRGYRVRRLRSELVKQLRQPLLGLIHLGTPSRSTS